MSIPRFLFTLGGVLYQSSVPTRCVYFAPSRIPVIAKPHRFESSVHCTRAANSFGFPAAINSVLEAVCAAQTTNAQGSFMVTYSWWLRNCGFLARDETPIVAVPQHDCMAREFEPELNGRSLSRNDTPNTCFARSLLVSTDFLSNDLLALLPEYLTTTPLPDTVTWTVEFPLGAHYVPGFPLQNRFSCSLSGELVLRVGYSAREWHAQCCDERDGKWRVKEECTIIRLWEFLRYARGQYMHLIVQSSPKRQRLDR
ncbi:hypothetical protein C8R44DRAFT_767926 [Mycena epipterygia]|nr:hypothetical protein C8R44DRAFT_767926 [Mycena epipterygia]